MPVGYASPPSPQDSADGVVIVGAGPTGLTTALLLAHYGVACTVRLLLVPGTHLRDVVNLSAEPRRNIR